MGCERLPKVGALPCTCAVGVAGGWFERAPGTPLAPLPAFGLSLTCMLRTVASAAF